jgi:hypothetical protein
MFGIPIGGPTDIFCGNKSMYQDTSLPESVPSKKQHGTSHRSAREAVAGLIVRITKEDNLTNLADLFTKADLFAKMMNKLQKEDRSMYRP